MNQLLAEVIRLRAISTLKESNKLVMELVENFPENPQINYQCAWSFDLLGEEEEAVPFYEKAIELGLDGTDLEGALLGLGSTYRALGMYQESKGTFLKGIELFSANNAMSTFLAMTLYNLKEYQKAMETLLQCIVKTSNDKDIQSYKKAIEFYSDKLDKTWK